MKKFQRLIGLLYLLRRGPIRALQIAEKLGTTERTVYRDIAELDDALGDYVRILHTHQNGYSLDRNLYAPPLSLMTEEYEAMQIAIQALEPTHPHRQIANQALSKILNHGGAKPGLAKLEHYLDVMPVLARDRTPVKHLQELEQQLRKKCLLELEYFSHHSREVQKILFAPYALIYRKNAWYLLGEHQTKAKVLLLRAYRIHKSHVTDQPFQLPEGFSISKHFKSHWEVYDGLPESIHLRFYQGAALRVQEMSWHPSQKIVTNQDQSVDLYLNAPNNPELISWILGWGSECEVLAPLELRQSLTQTLQNAAQRYT